MKQSVTAEILPFPGTDPLLGSATTELNQARVSGKDSPEWQNLIARPVTFLLPRSRARDAKQKEWKNSTAVPLRDWLEGNPDGCLTKHRERPEKGYFPIVFGSAAVSNGYTKRAASGMKTVEFVGIDVDSGDDYESALGRVEALGLACIGYTSFRSGAEKSQINRDAVLRALKIDRDPTTAELRAFLAPRLHPKILDTVEVVGQSQDASGVQIDYSHAPLTKYRLLFPLESPLTVSTLARSQREALNTYARKVRGFARKLDLMADEACFDVSRVFYMPSHPPGGDFALDVIRGRGLALADIPEAAKEGTKNAFGVAGAGAVDRQIAGMPAKVWAAKYAKRLELARLIDSEAPDRIREDKGGILVVECPFDELHSNAGDSEDTACHVKDGDGESGFVWACKHNSCAGHDRLDMLHKALSDGWFDESCLISEDYLAPLPDDEEDEDSEVIEPEAGAISAADLQKRFRKMIRRGAGKAAKIEAIRDAVKQSGFGKREVSGLWDEEERALIQKPQGRSTIPAKALTADFNEQITYAQKQITAANADAPRMFEYMDSFAVVDERRGRVRLLETQNALFAEVHNVTRWEKVIDDKGNTRLVAPPEDVVRFLHNDATFKETMPEISGGVVTTPFFAADGSLVIEPGYHAGAKVFLAPTPGLVVPRVSGEPTAEEVAEAKRLIIAEVLADFPLGGMTRAQIVSAKGEKNAPIAHTIGYMILPFCREMIAGPTPGHVFTKPAPGTGASLLDDMCAMIDAAEPAPAIVPKSGDEMGKVLTSVLKKGPRRVRFDNAHDAIASADLASAMTAPTYGARILGASETVDVAVRAVWGFTANNFEASKEILRRLIFIPLDAGEADPENRTPVGGWRHKDLRDWVSKHRGELVWACLTLIQNWVSKGAVPQESITRGSYGAWAGVIGGILNAAKIDGFLLGQDEEQEKARDSSQDAMQQFIDVLADFPPGTLFRPGGNTPFEKMEVVSLQAVLNGELRAGDDRARVEPIQIPQWGYDRVSGQYETAGKIGQNMKTVARKPWRSADKELTFAMLDDTRNKTKAYRLGVKVRAA